MNAKTGVFSADNSTCAKCQDDIVHVMLHQVCLIWGCLFSKALLPVDPPGACFAAHLRLCHYRTLLVLDLNGAMIIQYLPHLASKNIVLASASPRRLQLLQLIGMSPKVVTSNFEENLPKSDYKSAADYAIATSKGKALDVAKKLQETHQPADLVIGSDTVSGASTTYSPQCTSVPIRISNQ